MDNNQFNEFKEYEVDLSGNSKLYAVLAYLGILFVVGLIAEPEKDNPFVKNHVNNGVLIFIGYWAAGLVCAVPFVGWIVGAVALVVVFVINVIGFIYAIQGKFYNIPYCNNLKIIK